MDSITFYDAEVKSLTNNKFILFCNISSHSCWRLRGQLYVYDFVEPEWALNFEKFIFFRICSSIQSNHPELKFHKFTSTSQNHLLVLGILTDLNLALNAIYWLIHRVFCKVLIFILQFRRFHAGLRTFVKGIFLRLCQVECITEPENKHFSQKCYNEQKFHTHIGCIQP